MGFNSGFKGLTDHREASQMTQVSLVCQFNVIALIPLCNVGLYHYRKKF